MPVILSGGELGFLCFKRFLPGFERTPVGIEARALLSDLLHHGLSRRVAAVPVSQGGHPQFVGHRFVLENILFVLGLDGGNLFFQIMDAFR